MAVKGCSVHYGPSELYVCYLLSMIDLKTSSKECRSISIDVNSVLHSAIDLMEKLQILL